MELLPRSHRDFSSARYWERFFERRGDDAFEWYGSYEELAGLLRRYVKPSDQVLVVGCGNSELSERVHDAGLAKSVVSVDVSETAIRVMRERRPDLDFRVMDVTAMDFDDGSFQVVLDKGTLDALMPDSSPPTLLTVTRMFSEISRVLQFGGRYLCVSLAQEHILRMLVEHFSTVEGWPVRVHVLPQAPAGPAGSTEHTEPSMPVFLVVLTRFHRLPGPAQPPILELCLDSQGGGKPTRLESSEWLLSAVQDHQLLAIVRSRLQRPGGAGEDCSLDLLAPGASSPRYSLHVVDRRPSPPGKAFAIFIVPQGRESEWLFGSREGRRQLAASAGFGRLVVATLHRGQDYVGGMEAVQAELSGPVMQLAPPGLSSRRQQVPFLSAGGPGAGLGERAVRLQAAGMVVEDVTAEDARRYRRLLFLSNPNLIQSEARLMPSTALTTKKKNKKKSPGRRAEPGGAAAVRTADGTEIDAAFLSCDHHQAMVGGLALLRLEPAAAFRVLLVGLGGGSLPLFLHRLFPACSLVVVEIDPAVVAVASEWFGFCGDERAHVVVGDGVAHIRAMAARVLRVCCAGEPALDAVLFDVDSKEPALGMSCPPAAFVEPALLRDVGSLIGPHGLFMLNLVCRDSALKQTTVSSLKDAFSWVSYVTIPEEVNEVYYCRGPMTLLPAAPSPNPGTADGVSAGSSEGEAARKGGVAGRRGGAADVDVREAGQLSAELQAWLQKRAKSHERELRLAEMLGSLQLA
ncbi:eEF1A lysine and N-terminal methyltransferase isoform X1 [Lampetra fluviatilis]